MRELAHELRLDRSTLYRRFSENGCTFTIAEADIIARKLNLSAQEASAIFFAQFVA
ncbi:XRE family transcriptional regulator [Ruthenibacterium lactatiformans]|nr:XRE family transcriptional regulator [Ruthenibacterium lactatiformans]MBN3012710.1 XRE family transcriptional regulator [Ruthenibacterium lactatiformans]MBN3017223.1 XRE family transcriptional regulator [Ruthenibacterium lactatiformans]DAN39988.1 MAG TPA: repressor protein C2 [Caudoviricetes sp.]